MLKQIPQEQPDFMPQNNSAGKNKGPRINSPSKKRANNMEGANLPKSNPKIVEDAGKKLIAYSMSPEKHSDTEIRDIIFSMQRAIVHLQRNCKPGRKKRRNK